MSAASAALTEACSDGRSRAYHHHAAAVAKASGATATNDSRRPATSVSHATSGYGYEFAFLIGRILPALALDGTTAADREPIRITRPSLRDATGERRFLVS